MFKVWLSETSHGTVSYSGKWHHAVCMHAHMVCISPWPCTPACGSSAQRSRLEPCKILLRRSDPVYTSTEISTVHPVELGIYGVATNVTDTTVPLYRITSVTSSQSRT